MIDMRTTALMVVAALALTACGVPLQSDPEPLPSDVVPTTLQVTTPVVSQSPVP